MLPVVWLPRYPHHCGFFPSRSKLKNPSCEVFSLPSLFQMDGKGRGKFVFGRKNPVGFLSDKNTTCKERAQ